MIRYPERLSPMRIRNRLAGGARTPPGRNGRMMAGMGLKKAESPAASADFRPPGRYNPHCSRVKPENQVRAFSIGGFCECAAAIASKRIRKYCSWYQVLIPSGRPFALAPWALEVGRHGRDIASQQSRPE